MWQVYVYSCQSGFLNFNVPIYRVAKWNVTQQKLRQQKLRVQYLENNVESYVKQKYALCQFYFAKSSVSVSFLNHSAH